MNLHAIVRGAINANHADETFTWFRSLGQQNIEGLMQNTYADGVEIKGSFQSEGDSTLDHSNLAGQNSLIRKLYVFADNDAQMRPYALYRPLARTGDYIVDKYNAYWFVVAVEEDFSQDGWECLRVQMSDKTPVINIKARDPDGENSSA